MGLISEEYIVGCNNFFSHIKLALWNLWQNNIYPFLLLFCFLSSSGILGATEWGPNFKTFFVIINCSCYNFLQVDDVDKACPQIHKNNSVNCVLWSSAVSNDGIHIFYLSFLDTAPSIETCTPCKQHTHHTRHVRWSSFGFEEKNKRQ